jgi:hypothetical protein
MVPFPQPVDNIVTGPPKYNTDNVRLPHSWEKRRMSRISSPALVRLCRSALPRVMAVTAACLAAGLFTWALFQRTQADYPEPPRAGNARQLQVDQGPDRAAERERGGQSAFEALETAETKGDLPALVEQADRFLRDHAGTSSEGEVRRRRALYLRRIDERDVEEARWFSAQNPLHFAGRREQFRRYLERHPSGAFVPEATMALETLAAEWDRYDYRLAREQFLARPLDFKEVEVRGRAYLAAHPEGRFRSVIADLLRFCERSAVEGEFRIVLKSGSFDRAAKAWFSRGPKLAVEIEVNGVRHGPGPIAARGYQPEWDYEFPRRVRWKPGDAVVIRVTDHWYWRRTVLVMASEEGDPLALRLLSGPVSADGHTLTFESDFRVPELPEAQ